MAHEVGDDQVIEDKLNSALNLMRRMPPSSTENSLAGLLELAPILTDELLTHVDQPLKIAMDEAEGKEFVLCDYNRDGDSYRSPWTNEYYPPMEGCFKPNDKLRELEIHANQLFNIYRKLYFNGGFSSAYFFETDVDNDQNDSGFGACFLIHKEIEKKKSLKKGIWDSIHVFEVIATKNKHEFIYKLTTTVMISLIIQGKKIGTSDLSGLRTQQHELTAKLENGKREDHVQNMGKMLEDTETRLRNQIEGIYIQKTRTVINGMRGGNEQLKAQWGNIAESLKQSKFHKNGNTK